MNYTQSRQYEKYPHNTQAILDDAKKAHQKNIDNEKVELEILQKVSYLTQCWDVNVLKKELKDWEYWQLDRRKQKVPNRWRYWDFYIVRHKKDYGDYNWYLSVYKWQVKIDLFFYKNDNIIAEKIQNKQEIIAKYKLVDIECDYSLYCQALDMMDQVQYKHFYK